MLLPLTPIRVGIGLILLAKWGQDEGGTLSV
jgi:hypothetical protein